MGFFTTTEIKTKRPAGSVPRCGTCGLYQHCKPAKVPVRGLGDRRILVVAETPGGDVDALLEDEFEKFGVDLERDCWVTYAVTCRPPKKRDPLPIELESCLPNLLKAIRELDPVVIIPVGRHAILQIIKQLWVGRLGSGERWLGYRIPAMDWNAWVCPIFNPVFIQKKLANKDVERVLYDKQLAKVFALDSVPWTSGVPDYTQRVKVITDSKRAVDRIRHFHGLGVPLAFDYECDRMKPDSSQASIFSCAVSNGQTSIAFPWVPQTAKAMQDLLWDPSVEKMAWNLKFEERWTRRVFGKGVRNWGPDGMLMTHVMDNRQEISGLKFQTFVRYGMVYDSMDDYFDTNGGNEPNRIREADLNQVLVYNGLDALFTRMIAHAQRGEINAAE